MKKIQLLTLAAALSCFICTPYSIKVENETGYPIRVLLLYYPADINVMAKTVFSDPFKKDKIVHLIDKMDEEMFGFEGAFSDKNKKYFKQQDFVKDRSSIKKNVGAGCIRAAKVWIVEQKSIPGNEITLNMINQGDNSGTTLGKEYKDLIQNRSDWNLKVAQKAPVKYVQYSHQLTGRNWDYKIVPSKSNQCASHTFKAFVDSDNNVTLELTN
jgi:hypothetical protein